MPRKAADHRIRLNITPSSNVLLGRVPSLSSHPIEKQKISLSIRALLAPTPAPAEEEEA